MIKSVFYTAFTTIVLCAPAFAHIGHLGEAAGHGHWVGVAAVLGALAMGAATAKARKKKTEKKVKEKTKETKAEA